MKSKFILLILILSSTGLIAQNKNEEVKNTIYSMINELNNLQLDDFTSYFTDDAIVFFPRPPLQAKKVIGRENIKNEFSKFFASVKSSNPDASPPYLNIIPLDFEVRTNGNMAFATFHIDMNNELHRRTVILEKIGKKWKVAHLHASFHLME
ncbi:YybH family protein [Marinigracilibium pacificum]|uniref:Nuclear transport factor 2 family protein n=1 Tax=Marinigracilibium pacificum TaxID=2729599 RepID=A0A848IZP4_9BACT|nr:nuclear transport factor 2 family protein [Marinigracilibium pacificum]NMM47770.1 nuclear transport factor 2 family protein [Marinigracilibium pacificum]